MFLAAIALRSRRKRNVRRPQFQVVAQVAVTSNLCLNVQGRENDQSYLHLYAYLPERRYSEIASDGEFGLGEHAIFPFRPIWLGPEEKSRHLPTLCTRAQQSS